MESTLHSVPLAYTSLSTYAQTYTQRVSPILAGSYTSYLDVDMPA